MKTLRADTCPQTLPAAPLDALIAPGAPQGCHEFYAAREADAAAACGFALALGAGAGGAVLWVREARVDSECGAPHPQGLNELGLDPARVVLVRARNTLGALQAGLDGVRCAGLGGVLLEMWGDSRLYDLTASRRLSLAARSSGVTLRIVRAAADPQPSAADTRWRIAAAPSAPLAANAPGMPDFALTLLRHRAGFPASAWHLEWNRDDRRFLVRPRAPSAAGSADPPLSGAVAAFPRPRSAPQAGEPYRRAG